MSRVRSALPAYQNNQIQLDFFNSCFSGSKQNDLQLFLQDTLILMRINNTLAQIKANLNQHSVFIQKGLNIENQEEKENFLRLQAPYILGEVRCFCTCLHAAILNFQFIDGRKLFYKEIPTDVELLLRKFLELVDECWDELNGLNLVFSICRDFSNTSSSVPGQIQQTFEALDVHFNECQNALAFLNIYFLEEAGAYLSPDESADI